jgi:rubrerythrin
MAYETIRHLLDDARKFHQELEALYEQESDQADKDKLRMILDFMGRHEKALEQWIAETEAGVAPRILDMRLHFMPDIAECEDFAPVTFPKDVSIQEAIRTALHFDDCLVAYYRQMAEGPVPPEVKELFRVLMRAEKSEEREVIESALLMNEP